MGRRSLAVLWICLMVVAAGRAEAQNLDEFVQRQSLLYHGRRHGEGAVLSESSDDAAAGQHA